MLFYASTVKWFHYTYYYCLFTYLFSFDLHVLRRYDIHFFLNKNMKNSLKYCSFFCPEPKMLTQILAFAFLNHEKTNEKQHNNKKKYFSDIMQLFELR